MGESNEWLNRKEVMNWIELKWSDEWVELNWIELKWGKATNELNRKEVMNWIETKWNEGKRCVHYFLSIQLNSFRYFLSIQLISSLPFKSLKTLDRDRDRCWLHWWLKLQLQNSIQFLPNFAKKFQINGICANTLMMEFWNFHLWHQDQHALHKAGASGYLTVEKDGSQLFWYKL